MFQGWGVLESKGPRPWCLGFKASGVWVRFWAFEVGFGV